MAGFTEAEDKAVDHQNMRAEVFKGRNIYPRISCCATALLLYSAEKTAML